LAILFPSVSFAPTDDQTSVLVFFFLVPIVLLVNALSRVLGVSPVSVVVLAPLCRSPLSRDSSGP